MSKKESVWKKSGIWTGRVKETLLMGALAILLFSVAWIIFREDEPSEVSVGAQLSETEIKVARILEEIEGVGEASVIVCEDEDKVKSVVVVCEGANDLRVVMNVREAVSAALGTEEKSVKIYLKKE